MIKYSEEQTKYIIETYQANPQRETVRVLSEELKKSEKSIIGKLSREGVYRREVYKTKSGEDPITKTEIVQNIGDALGLEIERLAGLEKAPKGVLKQIVEALNGVVAGSEKVAEETEE